MNETEGGWKSEVGKRPKTEDRRRKNDIANFEVSTYELTNYKEGMKFKFENLVIWQKSMDLGESINSIANNFPSVEKYNLSSQIRRAADSIALNISEGSTGQSDAEQIRFIGYAIRSVAEVVTCLHKAKLRKYITNDQFNNHYEECYNLMNMTIAFKKGINKSS